MSKELLEESFQRLLEQLQPKPKAVALFREIVLDVWKHREAEAGAIRRRLERTLAQLKDRKDQLVDAFIYDKAIDRDTYETKVDKLNEEIALRELEQNEARLDQLDVEGVLAFGEHLLLNAARLWTTFNLDQKQRFQQIVFPDGIVFDGTAFGTAVTCPVFSYLRAISGETESMACPTGFEPPA